MIDMVTCPCPEKGLLKIQIIGELEGGGGAIVCKRRRGTFPLYKNACWNRLLGQVQNAAIEHVTCSKHSDSGEMRAEQGSDAKK